MFLGINIFRALHRAHYNPHPRARAKIESQSGPTQKLYCFILPPPGKLYQF